MANIIKPLFWLRKTKANKLGQAPLMIRLSFQNKRLDRATGHYIKQELWNAEKQRVKGNKDTSTEINGWINSVFSKISAINTGTAAVENVHLPTLMDRLFAKAIDEPTLLGVIEQHINDLKERVGKDFAYSTYEKYKFMGDKVRSFIHESMRKKDILLKDASTRFIMDFDHYLRVQDNNKHNTAVKYCLNLKRVMNVCVMRGLISVNPFLPYKTVYKDTEQIYLSEEEVARLYNARLTKPNHQLVRDLFMFQCYTGLAYTDMMTLTSRNISSDHHGKQWIIKVRQKTGITSTIPLLPKAFEMINRYSKGERVSGPIFVGYSIQKYNQYLTEIGDLVGLNKKLSSHVGRRTFGNIALTKGISLNVISKILGHSNTIITQRIYAITTQGIISQEVEKWK